MSYFIFLRKYIYFFILLFIFKFVTNIKILYVQANLL